MSEEPRSIAALYKQVILEHSKRPRNHGALEPCSHEARGINPLCGDRVTVQLRVSTDDTGRMIKAIRFRARGCAIAKASASLMTEHVTGLTVAQARTASAALRALVAGESSPLPGLPDASALDALLGVRAYPSRLRCATLAWETLEDALSSQMSK